VSRRLCREAALFPLGTGTLYRGFFLCRELNPLLSANRLCAESLGSGSRHRSELSVEAAFPVVCSGGGLSSPPVRFLQNSRGLLRVSELPAAEATVPYVTSLSLRRHAGTLVSFLLCLGKRWYTYWGAPGRGAAWRCGCCNSSALPAPWQPWALLTASLTSAPSGKSPNRFFCLEVKNVSV
jgi:hypothetical protein